MDPQDSFKNISSTKVTKVIEEKKINKKNSQRKSRKSYDVYKSDYSHYCDCETLYCRCNEIEEDAGFTIDYRSDSKETMGKYVCKLCYKLPIKCECL